MTLLTHANTYLRVIQHTRSPIAECGTDWLLPARENSILEAATKENRKMKGIWLQKTANGLHTRTFLSSSHRPVVDHAAITQVSQLHIPKRRAIYNSIYLRIFIPKKKNEALAQQKARKGSKPSISIQESYRWRTTTTTIFVTEKKKKKILRKTMPETGQRRERKESSLPACLRSEGWPDLTSTSRSTSPSDMSPSVSPDIIPAKSTKPTMTTI